MATYIVDLDGTIADCTHRLHYIRGEHIKRPRDKNWKAFLAGTVEDTPIWPVLTTVYLLRDAGAHIIFASGRNEDGRKLTQEWLQNLGFNFEPLFMRKSQDYREDYIVKAEILTDIQRRYPHLMPITGVFDDRKQVVDMWRAHGLTVFHVAEGNY